MFVVKSLFFSLPPPPHSPVIFSRLKFGVVISNDWTVFWDERNSFNKIDILWSLRAWAMCVSQRCHPATRTPLLLESMLVVGCKTFELREKVGEGGVGGKAMTKGRGGLIPLDIKLQYKAYFYGFVSFSHL